MGQVVGRIVDWCYRGHIVKVCNEVSFTTRDISTYVMGSQPTHCEALIEDAANESRRLDMCRILLQSSKCRALPAIQYGVWCS
jgi:hypothetical protein